MTTQRDIKIAQKIMDIDMKILDEHGAGTGLALNRPDLKFQFITDVRRLRLKKIPQGVLDILENENFHTAVEILVNEEKKQKFRGWKGESKRHSVAAKKGALNRKRSLYIVTGFDSRKKFRTVVSIPMIKKDAIKFRDNLKKAKEFVFVSDVKIEKHRR